MEWLNKFIAYVRIRYALYKRYRLNKKHGLTTEQVTFRDKLISACCKVEHCELRVRKAWYGWKIEVYSE